MMSKSLQQMSTSYLVLSSYKQLFQLSLEDVDKIGVEIPIPSFLKETVDKLIDEAILMKQTFSQSALIELTREIVIVGDIHGNLVDLMRIFRINGLPPKTKYLFLGDYVDRGSFSLECICLVMALSVLYPQHIFCIRGNHELADVNKIYGFYDEIVTAYSDDALWTKFNQFFEYLPLAAIIDNQYFCVHGGITKSLTLSYLRDIKMPITNVTNVVNDLLWSDPNDDLQSYSDNIRGCGIEFGYIFCANFLEMNKLQGIIRGHQCVKEGVKVSNTMNVVTVFSSSSYTQDKLNPNLCGFLIIDDKGVNKRVLEQIDMIPRNTAYFFTVQPEKQNTIPQRPLATLSGSTPQFFSGSATHLKGIRALPTSSSLLQKKTHKLRNTSVITKKSLPILRPLS